ncbi:thioredoxin family protein [Oikeobacillus pervagus]|nr:thioredoxin family protein [Oikeobacillus pervagus]
MVQDWSQQPVEQLLEEPPQLVLYLYTPLCGTCQVAGKMVQVLSELLPGIPFAKLDLNFHEQLATKYLIESVPCLLFFQDGEVVEKIYAFHSVPHLYHVLTKYQ